MAFSQQDLVDSALAVRQHAYAPYSNFLVGAAILSPTGKLFVGCNMENASYGLSICAERSALAAMVASGERELSFIAVASRGAVTPCGACRQTLSEFGSEFGVLLIDSETGKPVGDFKISELLPYAFDQASLRPREL